MVWDKINYDSKRTAGSDESTNRIIGMYVYTQLLTPPKKHRCPGRSSI